MSRLLALALAACIGALAALARDPGPDVAARCFEQAPTSVLPLISKNTRLDMIDYFRAGSDRQSANQLDGPARITALERNLIAFEAGSGLRCQMLVIDNYRFDKSAGEWVPIYVIGLIETLDTPIPDSKITFYDSKWQPIKGAFTPPRLADWLTTRNKDEIEMVKRTLPFITVEYAFDPQTLAVIATPTISRYFVADDAEAAKALALLRPAITYRWDDRKQKFVMTKQ